ncbi:MAG: protein kinase [Elusimicrobiota bacterium]
MRTHPDKADEYYQHELAANPRDDGAWMGHIQALTAQGRRSEATTAAQNLLSIDPTNKLAKQTIEQNAKLDDSAGVVKKFEKLAQTLLHGPSDDTQTAGQQQAMKDALGAAAAENLRAAGPALASPGFAAAGFAGRPSVPTMGVSGSDLPEVQRPFSNFAPLVLRALDKERIGDLTGALIDATQATDAAPRDPAAWTTRAEIDNRLENYPSGIIDAGRAVALAPQNARALRARAFAELESGRYDAALADSAKSVELDPASGNGFLYKAMAEQRLGRAEAASTDLQQAVALDPSLAPLAAPLMKTLGIVPPSPAQDRVAPHLVRGGIIILSLGLVLFGLLGTQTGRQLTRRFTPRRPPQPSPEIEFLIAAPVADLAPGSMLGGNYRIVKEIGRGGMGVVYEGRDETLQRRVAVKRLIEDSQTTPDDIIRFIKEARLVAQLRHPNIAEIYTVVPGTTPFLIFEFVDGQSLDKILKLNRILPLPSARRVVREVASALASAHAAGIIHRDLKPSNVMIASDGAVKVMDFGIAHQSRSAATKMTQTNASGTPPYMAPEQGWGSVSKASDVYALGVMTYELVTGSLPFVGPDFLEQKLELRYEAASRRSSAIPAELDALFAATFDPDPTKRPAGTAAFADAFDRACGLTPRPQANPV